MHHPHPILVTGAAGRVGARGPVVTKALLDSTYLGATTSMVVVCEHHGVDAFVNMSQMTVSQMGIHETTDSPQHKQQWLAEQVLRWSGLPVVYMRPTAFMEVFFLQLCSPTIRLNSTRVRSAGRSRTWTFPSSPGRRSSGSQECHPTLPRISSRWPPCTDRTATTAIPILSRS